MRIRLAIPSGAISAPVLNAALEASTLANQHLLTMGEAPSIEDAIRAGVRWKPEPFSDGEHFDLAPVAAARGWGDCDDLAPWLAADLRLRGDRGAKAFAKQTGPQRWHALVRTGDGEILDPSKWAGMGKRRGARAAISGQMAPPGGGAICIVPHPRGGWAARADLPWGTRHISGLAREREPEEAFLQACRGAAIVGECNGLDLGDFESLVGVLCGDQEEPEIGRFLILSSRLQRRWPRLPQSFRVSARWPQLRFPLLVACCEGSQAAGVAGVAGVAGAAGAAIGSKNRFSPAKVKARVGVELRVSSHERAMGWRIGVAPDRGHELWLCDAGIRGGCQGQQLRCRGLCA